MLDGAGEPVPDALVETWQADPDGRFDHPDDPRGRAAGFRGFGRCPTGADGSWRIVTRKPGPVPGADGAPQAPHVAVSLFARGLLDRVVTRIYFGDEPAANAADPLLARAGRRAAGDAHRGAAPTAATSSTSTSRASARRRSCASDGSALRPALRARPAPRGGVRARLGGGDAGGRGGARGGGGGGGRDPRGGGRGDRRRRRRIDPAALGEAAVASGTPVVPLVAALRERVGAEHAEHVHHGATSQDIVDTAAMLVARRARALIVEELDAVARACAALAREHAATAMAGRTLLQQALPVTFGLKAAGWLDATLDARAGLLRTRLDAQLGGAAGTLAALGDAGPAVAEDFARRLGLGAPALPWHTARGRVAELGAALAVAAGTMGKLGLDLVLLAQSEVAEVVAGAGASSAMPHKRNPVGAVRARACALRVPPLAALLLGAMAQEHERAAGAWQAEWEPLGEALGLTGGAAAGAREALEDLEVRPDAMRAHLDALLAAPGVAGGTGAAALFVERALSRAEEELGA